jgi:hypothetical protein
MNEEYQLLNVKFNVVKDSVKTLSDIVVLQKEYMDNKDKEIILYKSNQESQENIIKEKDTQISEYKKIVRKQKTYKLIGFGTSTVSLVVVVLLLL